jgi:predicted AlkP superfamily phosphohydrolase/phosphomutase
MTGPPSKIVVVGIDAASPALLREWASAGLLPNVRALMDRGLSGRTRGVDGFFIGSTWPSFYTGVMPGAHGFHYLVQLRPGTYEYYSPVEHGIVRHDAFWSRLSRAGRRVAILDVPLTRLDASLNGVQTVEWGGHDVVYGFQAAPLPLAGQIRASFGTHPFEGTCDRVGISADDYARFVSSLEEGAQRKGALTASLLQQGGWDFFMQVFTESHCVGHQCWHLHAPEHPAHDADVARQTGDPLRRVYASIDRALGHVVAAAGDAVVVLLVAHGMSHWYGADFLLPDILVRLGVARPVPVRTSRLLDGARQAWRRLPPGVRGPVARLRRSWAPPPAPLPTIGMDPTTSLCFPHRNGQAVSGIRLNVAGREPLGRLSPAEADAFGDRLAQDLLGIVDERTGMPIVRRVRWTRDVCSGAHAAELPDLLVEWSDDVATGSEKHGGAGATVRAIVPGRGVVEGTNQFGRTGEHRSDGLFVAAGAGIGHGELERQISILDFAPTIAARLGVDADGWEGRVVPELLARP